MLFLDIWINYIYDSFLNLNFFIIFISVYLVFNLITTTSLYKLLGCLTLVLIWVASLLFYFQFELIGALLLVSELVVSFFFFLIFLTKNSTWTSSLNLIWVFFLLNYNNTTYIYLNFFMTNWYLYLWDLNNDVFLIYLFFFEQQINLLGGIGVILFILTLSISWISFFFKKIYFLKKKNLYNFLTLKNQKKKNYIRQKSLFYSNNLFF